jgi:hypothetical protein
MRYHGHNLLKHGVGPRRPQPQQESTMIAPARTADFQVENHGSIMLVRPLSRAASDWLELHTDPDSSQYWGDALVVEPRYLGDLVAGMQGDGLEVR